ncbi:MAG: RtcB family protein, partial [Oscillospiraceae bacterium]
MQNLKIFAKTVEQEAIDQVELLLAQPAFQDCKVRIMPDTHAGKGCVIGFTADLGDKVIPNIVGVDLCCGIQTVYLKKQDIDLQKLDKIIRQYIPSGRNVHENRIVKFSKLKELKCFSELKNINRLELSVGTLGGGNHFIEVDVDEDNNSYLIIHTGSRNLGKQVAEYYQNIAFELMRGIDRILEVQNEIISEYKVTGRTSEIAKALYEVNKAYKENHIDTPKELCYLTGKYRDDYLHDMKICQEYAQLNRETIAKIILEEMGLDSNGGFQTIHNYIDHDSNIVRKGAIRANKDELVLIPINMRDGCILGRGKGNEDWNCSAPHGAGRLMSRIKAKNT